MGVPIKYELQIGRIYDGTVGYLWGNLAPSRAPVADLGLWLRWWSNSQGKLMQCTEVGWVVNSLAKQCKVASPKHFTQTKVEDVKLVFNSITFEKIKRIWRRLFKLVLTDSE